MATQSVSSASVHFGEFEFDLRTGFQHHCDGLQFLKAEPIYENLQGDAKFQELVSRLRL
jgi:hypothetical protein